MTQDTHSPTSSAPPIARAPGVPAKVRGPIGRVERIMLPVVTSVAILAVWEIATTVGMLPGEFVPPPSAIFVALVDVLVSGQAFGPLLATLGGSLLGLLIATVLGAAIGTAIGINWYLYRALRPIIEFMRPVPSIATIPLVVLVLGIGFESKLFLITFGCIWPILVQTMYGVRDTDPVGLDTARVFGLPPLRVLLRIRMPNSLPFIATGVRISASISLVVAVTVELVIGMPGLGYAISTAQQSGAFPEMYAYVAIAGVVGVVYNVGLRALERRTLRWHVSQRRGQS